jgi:hypothetical protein
MDRAAEVIYAQFMVNSNIHSVSFTDVGLHNLQGNCLLSSIYSRQTFRLHIFQIVAPIRTPIRKPYTDVNAQYQSLERARARLGFKKPRPIFTQSFQTLQC